jgi:hypothetical protein
MNSIVSTVFHDENQVHQLSLEAVISDNGEPSGSGQLLSWQKCVPLAYSWDNGTGQRYNPYHNSEMFQQLQSAQTYFTLEEPKPSGVPLCESGCEHQEIIEQRHQKGKTVDKATAVVHVTLIAVNMEIDDEITNWAQHS